MSLSLHRRVSCLASCFPRPLTVPRCMRWLVPRTVLPVRCPVDTLVRPFLMLGVRPIADLRLALHIMVAREHALYA